MIAGPRPLLRGYLHAVAAVLSVPGAGYLMARSADDPPRLAALSVYGVGLTLLFTASAAYHLRAWGQRMARILRRLDHASIFVLIAATHTPVAFVLLSGPWRAGVLLAVWLLAGASAIAIGAGVPLAREARVAIYVAMGWVGGAAIFQADRPLPAEVLAALLAGGLLYTAGAVLYALRRPELWPRVFGYHEAFHLLTIVAAALFYWLIAGYVLDAPRR